MAISHLKPKHFHKFLRNKIENILLESTEIFRSSNKGIDEITMDETIARAWEEKYAQKALEFAGGDEKYARNIAFSLMKKRMRWLLWETDHRKPKVAYIGDVAELCYYEDNSYLSEAQHVWETFKTLEKLGQWH